MKRIRRSLAVLGVVAAPFIASTAVAKTGAAETHATKSQVVNGNATAKTVVRSAPDWLDEALTLRGLRADQRKQIADLRAFVIPAHQATIAARKAFLDELAAQA